MLTDCLGFSWQLGILKNAFGSNILCKTGQSELGSKMLAPHDRGLHKFPWHGKLVFFFDLETQIRRVYKPADIHTAKMLPSWTASGHSVSSKSTFQSLMVSFLMLSCLIFLVPTTTAQINWPLTWIQKHAMRKWVSSNIDSGRYWPFEGKL